jgi:hypothetical protein
MFQIATLLAAASTILAATALLLVVSLRQKVQAISQAHWELHYEFGRLRARVAKLDGGSAGATGPDDSAAAS